MADDDFCSILMATLSKRLTGMSAEAPPVGDPTALSPEGKVAHAKVVGYMLAASDVEQACETAIKPEADDDRTACFMAGVVLERVRRHVDDGIDEVGRLGEKSAEATWPRRVLRRSAESLPDFARRGQRACGVDWSGITREADAIAAAVPPRGRIDLAAAKSHANDLRLLIDGMGTVRSVAGGSPGPGATGSAAGGPAVVILTDDGYATIRGPKGDVTAFLRLSDGEIDYHIYPPGKAPRSGTDEDVLDLHQKAEATASTDGGTWEAGGRRDIEGFEEEVFRETGARVRIATGR